MEMDGAERGGCLGSKSKTGSSAGWKSGPDIRLLDISLSGALLAGEAPLPVGTRAQLRAGVGPAPFAPEVQVQRQVDRGGREANPALGAVFVGMDDSSRRSLEEFLRKASE